MSMLADTFASVKIICALAICVLCLGFGPSVAASGSEGLLVTSKAASLLEKSIPSLPGGFSAQSSDPWGHRMGDQTAAQFAQYYDPLAISSRELEAGGFLEAYSEFASGKTHKKSDYLTISLVRLTNETVANEVARQFKDLQTQSLTPAPPGGSVKEILIPGVPGAQAYQGWFDGSAYSDIVFVRGGVVVDLDWTSPSRSAAARLPTFAKKLYRSLTFGSPRLT